MHTEQPSPAAHDEQAHSSPNTRPRRWPLAIAALFILYTTASILTLPLADDLWLGELPLLAVVQIPKMFLASLIQKGMIALLPFLGLATGSISPDRILTHPWALGAALAAPALAVVCLLLWPRRTLHWRGTLAAILVLTALDAATTFWFDSSSSLSLF